MNKRIDPVLALLRRVSGRELTDGEVWELLSRHKCYGLLRNLPCPEEYRKEHTVNHLLNSHRIRVRYQTCASLFGTITEANIPYAVHKGAVLSRSLYGDDTVRRSGDIDLLICRDDADRVKQFLRSEGFVQGRITEAGIVPFTRYEILYYAANTHQLAPFVKKTDHPLCPYVNVDVNTDLLWGEAKETVDMKEILSHTEDFSVSGVLVRKLTPETEFIALCLHHYKDMNSLYLLYESGLKLGLFCDIYDYLHNVAPDPVELLGLCQKLAVAPYVRACISDAARVFGSDGVFSRYLTVLGERDLPDTFGLAEHELHRWETALPERIFSHVPAALDRILSPEEKEKIRLNQRFL